MRSPISTPNLDSALMEESILDRFHSQPGNQFPFLIAKVR
jgi:hypothetical protein